MAVLIDTHAHLDDGQFAADLPAVLDRARAAGVAQVVAGGTTAASSAACVALASQHPHVFATAGIHPNHAAEAAPGAWDEVVALAARPEVVGIGETGLDRHWNDTPFPVQEDYFARHLELGRRKSKPVVIHCREAEADVLRMLRADFDRNGPVRGVMHSFTGAAETAAACLAMGLHLSFAGMLTYKNAQALRDVAAKLPVDRLLVETDSPYLSPVPLRGKRNEPAHVVHTAACLAGLLGLRPEELAERTTRNARDLFGLPGPRPDPPAGAAAGPFPPLDILYEDNHCIAVAKPAGVPSTHYEGREETIDRAVKAYLKEKHQKPGNVFLGIVHRLDKPTSGVLLFARTSKAAARLARQFRDGAVEKVYWAVVEGDVKRPAGSLEDWLRKNEATGRVEVVSADVEGARQALLHYRRRAGHGGLTWLEVRPQTGRTHQLRVQLAHHGHPIYGDAKYGAVHTFSTAIGLHARSLTFLHPVRYEPITLTADAPRPWRGRFAYLFREGQP